MNRRPFLVFLLLVCILLKGHVSYGTQTDIHCLETVQKSLKGLLSSWDFSNKTEGFICSFIGIECWHQSENRVLNINLQDLGLKGQFPVGIKYCTTLTGLDLSGNQLNGSIPSDISKLLPFVTALDLSHNNFTGVIPTDLSNCSFLNALQLDHNQLSGHIPAQLGRLPRLKQFSVASNNLTGQVPHFGTRFPAASYAHNPGLCGNPLPPCLRLRRKSNNGVH